MVGEGMLGLGAGASVMTGIGIFAVVGYVTLSGMRPAKGLRPAATRQPDQPGNLDLEAAAARPGEHILVRPAESLPLSEFRLEKDMAVYGLPNETLLTFERSSIETFWELGFPKAANVSGLDGLVDVLLTFDLFCEFAPERYEADLVALPTSERKWILVSAARGVEGDQPDHVIHLMSNFAT